ncbi:MAG: PA0069 family radical SAM protein [Bacteroidota bacterium]
MKGRGATANPNNKFSLLNRVVDHVEGIDEQDETARKTQLFEETPQKIIAKNTSVDVPFDLSINPYQGCEHGCIYCYARNSHEYWGFSPGLDFESKIIIKPSAPALLERAFLQKNYEPRVIALSGNTDCYQPAERKLQNTRKLLELFLKYRNPVGIITKNSLIERDIDLLKELAELNLVHVAISITTLDEDTRRRMEPRTVSGHKRLETVEQLSSRGIPVNVMVAPIVPWINHHEIPRIVELSAKAGARSASYTVVRLNGALSGIFSDWVLDHYPNRASRVLNTIKEMHDGQLNDSDWGKRMTGSGQISAMIRQMFNQAKKKHLSGRSMPEYDFSLFRRQGHYTLFS